MSYKQCLLLSELIVVAVLSKPTVALSNHLRLQLHLELFAALPEAFDGVLKTG